ARDLPGGLSAGEDVGNIAWSESGTAWVGALAPLASRRAPSGAGLAVVALAPDRPWSVAAWSAVRTQATFLPLVLLAALLTYLAVHRHELALRQLRRALGQLPDRRVSVPVSRRLPEEVRLLADACNRGSEAIQQQNDT